MLPAMLSGGHVGTLCVSHFPLFGNVMWVHFTLYATYPKFML